MNSCNIIPFAFGENLVRVVMDECGEPLFVAKDVARALGYADTSNPARLFSHVPEEWAGVNRIHLRSENGVVQEREVLTISEPGLYFFLGRSDKPGALPFQKWMAGDVMSSIRKTGSYTMPRQARPEGLSAGIEGPLPLEALSLRPSMRQKLWQDALQTARLDGADSAAARAWFVFLCRMVAAQPPAPTPARDKVRAFFHQCCQHAEGLRVSASDLYAAFRHWHRGQRGDIPSMKVFGMCMQEFARRLHSNGRFYEGLCLKPHTSTVRA